MDNLIFEECIRHYYSSLSLGKSWDDLAKDYGFQSGEVLRMRIRRERKKRGMPSRDQLIQSNLNNIPNTYKTIQSNAKILCFDLENTMLRCVTFDLWEQNIRPEQVTSDSYIICWSAKFLNESKLYSDVLTSEEAIAGNDRRIVENVWQLLNGCNILIGQNIKNFDLKKLNVRFLYYGLPPIANTQIIDTYLISRSNFSFPSNSMKYINKFLGIKQKEENEGISLWMKCMEGDKESLAKMDDYCKSDTLAVENLYYMLRPFIRNGPNLGVYFDGNEKRCPNCGSIELEEESFYYPNAGKYITYRCECGSIIRSKDNLLDKYKKKSLLVN